jgi:3-isopropylmalate dehydrogenase
MSTTPAPSTLRLAVIQGDGIGKEVVPQGLRALRAALEPAGVAVETTDFDLGAGRWHRTGETLTDEDMARLAEHDAILLGAVGDPGVPSGVLERGLLLKLRFAFDHYVNLRPTRLFPGVATPLAEPGDVDFLVVREGTEGPYVGNGGSMRTGTPLEVATEVSLNTAVGVERVVRYAFEQAEARRQKLTLVHKHNVLVHAGHLWRRIVEEVGAEHPGDEVDNAHVDAMMIYLVQDPSRFDVIVTDNLFGDIVTDLAGAIGGGIGLAASGNVNPTGAFPSMFEPVHGSAPDIAGQDLADPTATVLSVALMLDHLGHVEPAAAVRAAVENDLAARAADPALASRGTVRTGDDLVAAIAGR